MGQPAPLGIGASGIPPDGDQANAVIQGRVSAVGPGLPFCLWGPMNLAIWGDFNTTLTTTGGSLTASVASAGTIAAGSAIDGENVPPGTTAGAITGTSVTLALPTLTLWGRTQSPDDLLFDLESTDWLLGSTVSGEGIPAATTVIEIVQEAIPAGSGATPSQTVKGIVRLSNAVTSSPTQRFPVPFTFALAADCVEAGADADALFTGSTILFVGSIQLERSFDGGSTWLVCNIGGGGTMAIISAGTPYQVAFGEPEKGVLYRLNCTVLSSGTINHRLSATGQAALSISVPTL